MADLPQSVCAETVPARTKPSNYPPIFARRMQGRVKRVLGDLFGLTNFGVNLTTLAPGSVSALQHVHSRQDEFVFVLSGTATLVSDGDSFQLAPGHCAGFKAGGRAHHLENRSDEPVTYLEIGDRTSDDQASYPNDDLAAVWEGSGWRFYHKDGTPY